MKILQKKMNFEELKDLEWLETNGLGAWCMGSVSGVNTRKYHSWLTVSYNPPTDRMVLIPKLSENIFNAESYFSLDANQFGEVISPKGYEYLELFQKEFYPKWEFKTPIGSLSRSLIMPHGKNQTILKYETNLAKGSQLHIRPFHIFREIHNLYNQNGYWFDYEIIQNGLKIIEKNSRKEVYIQFDIESNFNLEHSLFENVTFSTENNRGYDFIEHWATAGFFDVKVNTGKQTFYLSLSIQNEDVTQLQNLFDQEIIRRQKLTLNSDNEFERDLLLAADQFIVNRGSSKSIIAGYPWFTDWGRDTMISLEGICLATGRFDDAYQILLSFKDSVYKGLIPNRFVETGSTPEYNTIDATLWYVVAIYHYHMYSKRSVEDFYLTLKTIVSHHILGTLYRIRMDEDALLYGGEEEWQLTWMDAKLDGIVVTPRIGKPVEINALWYNVLKIAEYFSDKIDFGYDVKKLAETCKKSFKQKFIKSNGALYDLVGDDFSDDCIRPNQALLGAMPFKIIDKKTAEAIVKEIEEHLLTPHGLRTLNYEAQGYKGRCNGTLHERDYAYHQGTVWLWLWGSYADLLLYIDKEKGKKKIEKQLKDIQKHFRSAGIGSLSEVFDGDAPHQEGGCPAQAWSVAEVLRIVLKIK